MDNIGASKFEHHFFDLEDQRNTHQRINISLSTTPEACASLRNSLERSRASPEKPSSEMASTIILQPLSAFTFTTKEAQPEEDPSVAARLQRLQNNYEDFGMRRTVEGVLVCHEHGHPHVLMIQIANAFFKLSVKIE